MAYRLPVEVDSALNPFHRANMLEQDPHACQSTGPSLRSRMWYDLVPAPHRMEWELILGHHLLRSPVKVTWRQLRPQPESGGCGWLHRLSSSSSCSMLRTSPDLCSISTLSCLGAGLCSARKDDTPRALPLRQGPM